MVTNSLNYYDLHNDQIYLSKTNGDYAVLSGQLFIFAALIACFLKHYYLSILLLCLYVSTMLFWGNVHIKNSTEMKIADCTIAFFVILFFITYGINNYFKTEFKPIMYGICIFAITVFLINETVFYYTVKTDVNYSKIENIHKREFINNATVFSHILFIHIIPVFTYIYCAILSI